jgi:hypothetical protein
MYYRKALKLQAFLDMASESGELLQLPIRAFLDMMYLAFLDMFTNIRCFGYFNMDYMWTEMSEQTH